MDTQDIFPASGFDDWAETYDDSVQIDQFPFFGYAGVLEKAVALAGAGPGMRVLDLGTGTGNLAMRFAELGCDLWCTDFSSAMLERARRKLPAAHFYQTDLLGEWPAGLSGRFDRIVSAYVFHHFELPEKVRLVRSLIADRLKPDGRLVLADIAFPDQAAQAALKERLGAAWEEEFYWIAEETLPLLRQSGSKVEYAQVSVCAGIFVLPA